MNDIEIESYTTTFNGMNDEQKAFFLTLYPSQNLLNEISIRISGYEHYLSKARETILEATNDTR